MCVQYVFVYVVIIFCSGLWKTSNIWLLVSHSSTELVPKGWGEGADKETNGRPAGRSANQMWLGIFLWQLCHQTSTETDTLLQNTGHRGQANVAGHNLSRMFPRFQAAWQPVEAVINSPSVSIWMPESQLKERLIESASGTSWTGTQMNCAWGWGCGRRGEGIRVK